MASDEELLDLIGNREQNQADDNALLNLLKRSSQNLSPHRRVSQRGSNLIDVREDIERSPEEKLDVADLGEPLQDMSIRALIGLGDNIEEKRQALHENGYPQAELRELITDPGTIGQSLLEREVQVGGFERQGLPTKEEIDSERPPTTSLFFRADPSQPWQKVDPGITESFEPLNDIADLSGIAGSLAGELAPYAFPGTREGNLFRQTLMVSAGAAIGEEGQEKIENVFGIDSETPESVHRRALQQGAFAGVGLNIGAGAGAIKRGLTGGGLLEVSEAGQRALAASERLGLNPGVFVHEVVTNPVIRRLGSLAEQTSGILAKLKEKRSLALEERIASSGAVKDIAKLGDELQAAHNNMEQLIIAEAKQNPKALWEGGSALKFGAEMYVQRSGEAVDGLYQAARRIENPTLDGTQAVAGARELLQGTPAGRQGGGTVAAAEPEGELRDLLERLAQIDPNVRPIQLGERTVDPVEQIRAFRTDLNRLKTPAPGELPNMQHRIAGQAFRMVDDMLTNPTNTTPAFRNAWSLANQEAHKRYGAMETLDVIRATREDSLEALASKYGTPNSASAIDTLRGLMPTDQMKLFQDSVKNNWLERAGRGEDLIEILNGYDFDTLARIANKQEQATFRSAGLKLRQWRSAGVQQALEQQTKHMPMIRRLVDTGNSRDISQLVTAVRQAGGKDSALGKAIAGATYRTIMKDIIKRVGGQREVSENALEQILDRYTETGAIKLLRSNQIKTLRNVNDVAPFLLNKADAGSALSGAQTASSIKGIVTGGQGEGLMALAENMLISFLASNGSAKRFLIGKGVERTPTNLLKFMSGAGGVIVADALEEE